ncbi:MAG: TIGR02584 family CRISPR-associated protein [Piscirickettsiaceae bacterium CG_4_9_14_3_um_filter_43_564]|nr:TIGR02584 family CRISPR-associated protein [Thiomicrospira sp.]OIP94700.1 MAG: CRISPR-associated protein [Thiomicrospira sp. CG2_30_44_34]PIQ03226.1 MAG: TIGR02584 family CRISPR-associated protein [Piscirickettsiaceae bacterium CG18_big_fil_WC_8_21_14_2_50_44_103]PIU39501.1 MAG: TIGR02584 family CRISPR-associated protein [Piscirickettsiaceae bacterium CG07_land_8_20_14_0_80_44_28]PIW58588.1 MAG: TIGR02584 family CRISPR-associated protein [Piscirickettsiaceae bacterium CG12_big_fil_rev_8_21_1
MAHVTNKPIKKILFSILGTSPQILTETVYALTQNDPKFIPDEIFVLTTGFGAEQCIRGLFQANGGWFNKLCQIYNLNSIAFSPKHVISIRNDQNEIIQDIRTPEDNRAVANQISRMIRDFTSDPHVDLHVSIAGGRKTMGFYAGYALSMFGRDQDQLSHVLV